MARKKTPKKNKTEANSPSKIASFIRDLKARPDIRDFVHHEVIKPSNPLYSKTKEPLPEELSSALTALGIEDLYSHQALAIDHIRTAENTVVMTPTASGKSLIYNLPVIESILKEPDSRALYIFPLKGLEQDQLKTVREFISLIPGMETPPTAEIYDGDTPQHKRKKIRNTPPNILITNPDMLHLGICAFHDKWAEFFKDLKYVVIDELHSYRGVIGSHMAQLLRRLRRIAKYYNAEPVFITASATIANPVELSEELTGLDFTLIREDGAPSSEKNFLFLDPPEDMSPYTLATKIFTSAVEQGLRTIAFTKSRKVTELMHRWVTEGSPELATKVSSYRAGYLAEERREIERRLFEGELDGVISTSALELGIDIGGLDVCVLVGYPGTVSSTWQRAGRVGRGDKAALIVMVSLEDALDKYFMHRPEEFFTKTIEAATIDTENQPILMAHLPCAATEEPIKKQGDIYTDVVNLDKILEALTDERRLWYSPTKEMWSTRRGSRPHGEVSIRGSGRTYRVFTEDGTLLAETGSARVFKELHPGAIYMHRGGQYLVRSLHTGTNEVTVREVDLNYYTTPITSEDTEIIAEEDTKKVLGFNVSRGPLKTTEETLGYRKKELATRKVIDERLLELPPKIFTTKGIWWEVEEYLIEEIRELGYDTAGSLHALEHAMIAALPLYALCDRSDIGGVSYELNPEMQAPAIFIYDGHEGGIGLTERGYGVVEPWLRSTLMMLEGCPCEISCPACTQDPHCGNNNEPLDKRGAILILKRWLLMKI